MLAAGIIWWALAIGLRPDYPGGMLGGMLLTGVGVGLTLPSGRRAASPPSPRVTRAQGRRFRANAFLDPSPELDPNIRAESPRFNPVAALSGSSLKQQPARPGPKRRKDRCRPAGGNTVIDVVSGIRTTVSGHL
ncbi:MAG TPA: hypothetical protein VG268_16775 [Streptosporangiaceae bacterium]|nr:hypothetical protein [Streptosporangiaceae bacterium]